MPKIIASNLIAIILLIIPVLSQQFHLADAFVGKDFFQSFYWDTSDDPTHGRVNYVSQQTAQATNLSYASATKFVMRADYHAVVPVFSRGRDSVRVVSNTCWADSIVVADISHMPEGCATWPAFWTVSKAGQWPKGGEIDIIEGVNQNSNNLASLHTSPDCSMPDQRAQTGHTISSNCDSAVNYNQGCGVASTASNSYGSGFNSNGGGWYAMQRSSKGIFHWFWARNDPSVPDEIRQNDPITPGGTWGTPSAAFTSENCDYDAHFDCHQLIFDLTFCGDWAGSAYATAGCGLGNCEDFVNNYPDAFRNAYWEINSVKIYTPS